MSNILAPRMLHKLSRGEWASMTDTNDAHLCFGISVQEPGNSFPIGAVSCCWNTGHLWKGRCIKSLIAGHLHWTRVQVLRCKGLIVWIGLGFQANLFHKFSRAGFDGSGRNCPSSVLFACIFQLGLIWFAVTWMASGITAATAATYKDIRNRILFYSQARKIYMSIKGRQNSNIEWLKGGNI